MRQFIVIALLSFIAPGILFSQTGTIRGVVKDGTTGELLEGATVVQPPTNGTATDISGNYELKVAEGQVMLIISYVGLIADTEHVTIKAGQSRTLNVTLGGNNSELQTVVVTENKVGEKIQKATQSVEVMKPRTLEANNITNMEDAIAKIPGVNVLDGQMSVRGGSGYAYGAGSRVTLVVDDMPLMTADRADIKWPLVPIENLEQMELVKGANSTQYGSSALDGVLNVTTAYARDTPVTHLTFFYEGFGKPPVDSFQWWKRKGNFFQNPNNIGMSFLHSQKFGDFDMVFSGMMKGSQSYLQNDFEDYTRFSGKVRWHPHKLQRLTLELEASTLYDLNGFQFYWLNGGHPYLPAPGITTDRRTFYAYVDPKLRYIDKKSNEHRVYARLYRQKELSYTSEFWIYSLSYQFRHDFGRYFRLLGGANNDHLVVDDATLGAHKGDLGGVFVSGQLNYKFLTLNAGAREEWVHQDSAFRSTPPVFKAGASFEVRKYNYLRISFGQAFRIPSFAEKFVSYNLGGVEIIPNPSLGPERGYTTEIGYKRSIKIGNWLGYVDAAAFYTQFKDMIEFVFSVMDTGDKLTPFFQGQDVGRVRIFGWEFTLYGEGHITPNVDLVTTFGYTYLYGAYMDSSDNTQYFNRGNDNLATFLKNAFTHYILQTAKDDYTWNTETAGMLRYRYPHQFKADVDLILFKNYHIGSSLLYYSYMTQIDAVFAYIIPNVDEFRIQTRNQGDFMWDLRAGYSINRNVTLNFLVKNVLNSYTVIRVARPDPPRSFTVQMTVNFGAPHKNSRAAAAAAQMAN